MKRRNGEIGQVRIITHLSGEPVKFNPAELTTYCKVCGKTTTRSRRDVCLEHRPYVIAMRKDREYKKDMRRVAGITAKQKATREGKKDMCRIFGIIAKIRATEE